MHMTEPVHLQISKPALTYLQKRLAQQTANNPETQGFRLSLKDYGCSGQAYQLSYATAAELTSDGPTYQEAGLQFVLGPGPFHYLNNTCIDYLNTPIQQQLSFSHPLAINSCGCGVSMQFQSPQQEPSNVA
jgi:iron-sulfur cluster assembly accessory protein